MEGKKAGPANKKTRFPSASEIEDCTQEWTFTPGTFDFVHMRWLTGSIADWDHVFAEAYKVTKPGGWVQSYEPSSMLHSDHERIPPESPLGQWGRIYQEGGKKFGRSFKAVEDNLPRKAMEAAGFVDIREFMYKVSAEGGSRKSSTRCFPP